jgi:Tfp pilus assembly protein PilN
MPYINLIEEQRNVSQKNDLRARAGFFALVGVAVVFAGLYGFFYIKASSLTSEEADMSAKLQAMRPDLNRIDNNKKLISDMQPKLTTLTDAQTLTERWWRILNHFKTQMPPNTWLTSMQAAGTDPEKPVTMTLTGMALNQEPIGDFMMRTQNESDLDNLVFNYSSEKTTPYGLTIEFQMGASVVGTAPEKKEKEVVNK